MEKPPGPSQWLPVGYWSFGTDISGKILPVHLGCSMNANYHKKILLESSWFSTVVSLYVFLHENYKNKTDLRDLL